MGLSYNTLLGANDDHLRDTLCEAYKRSLGHTARRLLGYKDITSRTHGQTIGALESGNNRKLICIPRGCFKSSLASVAYPIWLLMNNPNIRILIESELFTNSVSFLTEIKSHIVSPSFQAVFGDWMPTKDQVHKKGYSWTDSEITISPREKILKDPSIQVGGLGVTKIGRHVDVIIGDDYNSPENITTPEQRKKVIDRYQFNQSILEPGGIYVIIGTRYHEDDLIGWVIKNELGFKTLDEFKKAMNNKNEFEPKGFLGGR